MMNPFQALVEDLEQQKLSHPTPSCLSDAALELLALGSLPPTMTAPAVQHLQNCLLCLQAYTSLRSLLEASEVQGGIDARQILTSTKPKRSWRVWLLALQGAFAWRVPLGVTAGLVAATMLLTSLATLPFHRMIVKDPVQGPGSISEFSLRGTAATRRTVIGNVLRVHDATFGDVHAHIVQIQDSKNAEYTVFVWGPPKFSPGTKVELEGVFVSIEEVGGRPSSKGLAVRIKQSPTP